VALEDELPASVLTELNPDTSVAGAHPGSAPLRGDAGGLGTAAGGGSSSGGGGTARPGSGGGGGGARDLSSGVPAALAALGLRSADAQNQPLAQAAPSTNLSTTVTAGGTPAGAWIAQ
jgi:hypothetical protein